MRNVKPFRVISPRWVPPTSTGPGSWLPSIQIQSRPACSRAISARASFDTDRAVESERVRSHVERLPETAPRVQSRRLEIAQTRILHPFRRRILQHFLALFTKDRNATGGKEQRFSQRRDPVQHNMIDPSVGALQHLLYAAKIKQAAMASSRVIHSIRWSGSYLASLSSGYRWRTSPDRPITPLTAVAFDPACHGGGHAEGAFHGSIASQPRLQPVADVV